MRYAVVIALILLGTTDPVLAATGPLHAYSKYGTVISAATLDASSTSFAINQDNATTAGIYGEMTVWIVVADSASGAGANSVTALNMSCTGSPDGGATDYTLQDISVAAGVGTSVNASWTKDPSGITTPKKWPWRVDTEGYPEVECTFTDTGGDVNDTLGVIVTFATKGG